MKSNVVPIVHRAEVLILLVDRRTDDHQSKEN
jgi:hypothetical protein